MNVWEAILLGILQGLTEFLPVSSSGHIELGKAILGIHLEEGLLFSIVLHAATALSTCVVFYKDIFQIVRELLKFEWNDSAHYATKIIISMIPVGILGIFFKDEIESIFTNNVLLVSIMLWVTAILLAFSYWYASPQGTEVSFWQAFVIGVAQAIAVAPGISRSGATIATSLLIGVEKSKAARFSFLMVLPPILGANILEINDIIKNPSNLNVSEETLIAGFLAAFIVGWLACKFMIEIVKRGKLIWFAIYCGLVGSIGILFSF
ncbi:MAG: undecaprenyl-diphosphate phosphatase [Cytophagales bacterium]|nr:undecaprenyl-diphosphate phosphatase [Cytophagales bacterium]MDW8383511.1 undecaprenyl-diphosphate phosphatase [Flammeovirgaceae bacterium]